MRSTDERVKAVFQEAKIMKQRQQKKQIYGVMAASCGLCFCATIVRSLVIPTMIVDYSYVSSTVGFSASIFANPHFLSYVIIGIISALLGASVTILCVLLHNRARQLEEENYDN
ncbi:hypothetical protein [Chakrabartyella piscis]|uniref:hypothetical protein n=1 Tax=Chakrabartyella piscis TaxID=2918914 RepID=UPI0029586D76|nr:hypothetical protein [Chakrabartyella piscis]